MMWYLLMYTFDEVFHICLLYINPYSQMLLKSWYVDRLYAPCIGLVSAYYLYLRFVVIVSLSRLPL